MLERPAVVRRRQTVILSYKGHNRSPSISNRAPTKDRSRSLLISLMLPSHSEIMSLAVPT